MGEADQRFADRLNQLIAAHGRAHGRTKSWTNAEIAERLKEINPELKAGAAYLSALRTGKKRNPNIELLTALADLFDVTTDYFLTSDDRRAQDTLHQLTQLPLLSKLRKDLGVRKVAARADGLTPEQLGPIIAVLDQLRAANKLPPVTEDGESSLTD
ncbi:hypothetical protein GCM10012275_59950 [Longimycelium tulufanense]|uniref:HTH cro/C1-type domain-containing protein n=1 Tax=Longimycelium tulufanense TaxID=907463 RepID=A0A8J3CKB2_9PSEU|nr:XRE family transcriptional regulator [Longimycelium tulufanense]GGM81311.1 hypothetical protein GCM10012275_59950 [Longimycelium tulufanense]